MPILLELLLLAIAAAFYPALLAVVIIFLARPHPKRLLAFFLAGALLVSVSIGLAAVTALDGADLGSSSKSSVSAGVYLTLGIVAVIVGAHFLRTTAKPKQPKKDSGPSMTQRVLSKDSSWLVFVLGIVLNMPGIWYVIGLKDIALADYSNAEKVLLVLGFNVIMFALVEAPLIGYLVAPEWSRQQVDKFNSWLHRHGRHLGGYIGVGLGAYLIARGIYAAI
jgi:Sap, sulfolipid-1-addressing protein